MDLFAPGISALTAGRRGLDIVGQNIANASTPGYHRQALNLVSKTVDGVTGVGVDVASITRYSNPPLRTAIIRGNSDHAEIDARLAVRKQIETTLGGGLEESLEGFFNQLGQLTSRTSEVSARRPFLATASELATRVRTASTDLDQLRGNVRREITTAIDELNAYAPQIADLNRQIMAITVSGRQPNELLDRRDQIINELSKRVDIQILPQQDGAVGVIASGSAVVVGEFATQYQLSSSPSGQLIVTEQGTGQPVSFDSGKVGAWLREYNTDLPATRDRLDTFATELIQRVNQAQATGLGTSGPLTASQGTLSVINPTTPLAAQNLPFPIQAGQLVVSVTDTTTGQRTNATVAIDPATQSLQDVASAITAATGGQVQTTVNPTSNTLQFAAQPGFAFDFAGRDTNPPGGGAIANPDTAGLLVGLGVNGFFVGSSAASIAVRPDILADPRLLAASRTGQPGDGSNLVQMAAIREQAAIGGRTLAQDLTDQIAVVGSDVRSLDDRRLAQAGILQNLTAQEESVRGVDVNEELLQLLQYERMIEGASRYLSVVNEALDSIMAITT